MTSKQCTMNFRVVRKTEENYGHLLLGRSSLAAYILMCYVYYVVVQVRTCGIHAGTHLTLVCFLYELIVDVFVSIPILTYLWLASHSSNIDIYFSSFVLCRQIIFHIVSLSVIVHFLCLYLFFLRFFFVRQKKRSHHHQSQTTTRYQNVRIWQMEMRTKIKKYKTEKSIEKRSKINLSFSVHIRMRIVVILSF